MNIPPATELLDASLTPASRTAIKKMTKLIKKAAKRGCRRGVYKVAGKVQPHSIVRLYAANGYDAHFELSDSGLYIFTIDWQCK